MRKILLALGIILMPTITYAEDGLYTPAIKLVQYWQDRIAAKWSSLPLDKQQDLLNQPAYKNACNYQLQTGGTDANKGLSYDQITQIMALYGTDSDEANAIASVEALILLHCKEGDQNK